MKKAIAAIFILIAITSISLFFKEEKTTKHIVEVSKAKLPLILHERGSFQPLKKSIIQSKIDGDILFILPNGTPVSKGDKVMTIDSSDTLEKIGEIQSQLDQEKASLTTAKAELAFAIFEEKQKKVLFQQRLDYARDIERDRLNSPTEDEVRQQDIDIHIAELDLQDAEDNFELNLRLFNRKFITEITLEDYRQRVKTKKEKLKELRLAKKILLKGISEEEKVELNRQVIRAQADLDRATAARQRRKLQLQEELNAVENAIEEANYKLSQEKLKLKQTTITAPRDGIFQTRTFRDWKSGGLYSHYSAGINLDRNAIVGDIIVPSNMQINFSLHENDFHLATKGMQVIIRPSPFPENSYKGHISKLGEVGADRNKVIREFSNEAGFSRFSANAVFDSRGDKFYSGMTADIEIILEKAQERLLVPRQAVITQGNKLSVTDLNGNNIPIEGRIFSDSSYEVFSGLSEGQKLLVPSLGDHDV